MLKDQLKAYQLILASSSPRRQQFLKQMDLDFEIRLQPVEEIYPNHLKTTEITDYLAQLKADPFLDELTPKDILITSDTIVWHNNKALGKPKDAEDAFNMLKALSNDTHQVFTSVCITHQQKQTVVNTTTQVTIKPLTDKEINYYITNYKPFDKAGAYGIQEWFGTIAITNIEGSYNNVVGLPTHLLYEALSKFL